jgi:4-amino-4-deoxy-L-arabinose transferase-like glycosyltransferase
MNKIPYPYFTTVIVLAFFAFAMSAFISRSVFDRLPHLEDEFAYQYQARIFAGGQIVIDSPTPQNAYWQPFVIDHEGQRFGKYTPGYPAVLAIGVLLGQAWVINAFAAMLTITLTYRLGREIFSADVGVMAAVLVACSPMALLLNATLMAHSVALFYTTLFMLAYWRLEQGQQSYLWGAVAGLALGLLAASRPLTSIAIAAPFIAWSGARLLQTLIPWRPHRVRQVLLPLVLLAAVATTLASSIPLFNYIATGEATRNPYTLIWEYDAVGFGECCGRNGHTLERALLHTRNDLTLTASDLFGWQIAPITAEIEDYLLHGARTYPASGYSLWLLPLGVIVGLLFHKHKHPRQLYSLIALWAVIVSAWVLMVVRIEAVPFVGDGLVTQTGFSYMWVGFTLVFLLLPLFALLRWRDTAHVPYTWMLMSVTLGIVIVQLLYWIGSQRYSTRYYFEALSAAALLGALPLAWLARRARLLVYGALIGVSGFFLLYYTLPRINVLHEFNRMSPALLNAVDQRRVDDRPVLVIVNGTASGDNRVRWRSYGALLAETSPYLDSPVVVARDYGTPGMRDAILDRFPDRQIIEMFAVGNEGMFVDEP